jgi:hypothetical protein
MPYASARQRRYFNANRGELTAQGVDVDEWNDSSRGKKLPEKVKDGKPVKGAKKPPRKKQAATLASEALQALSQALPPDRSQQSNIEVQTPHGRAVITCVEKTASPGSQSPCSTISASAEPQNPEKRPKSTPDGEKQGADPSVLTPTLARVPTLRQMQKRGYILMSPGVMSKHSARRFRPFTLPSGVRVSSDRSKMAMPLSPRQQAPQMGAFAIPQAQQQLTAMGNPEPTPGPAGSGTLPTGVGAVDPKNAVVGATGRSPSQNPIGMYGLNTTSGSMSGFGVPNNTMKFGADLSTGETLGIGAGIGGLAGGALADDDKKRPDWWNLLRGGSKGTATGLGTAASALLAQRLGATGGGTAAAAGAGGVGSLLLATKLWNKLMEGR